MSTAGQGGPLTLQFCSGAVLAAAGGGTAGYLSQYLITAGNGSSLVSQVSQGSVLAQAGTGSAGG